METMSYLDIIVKLAPAFVALVVGVFGSYIAYSQYITARNKLRLDLFDRRLDIYNKLQGYFIHILSGQRIEDCKDSNLLLTLLQACYISIFLFSDDVSELTHKIFCKATEINAVEKAMGLYELEKLNNEEYNLIKDRHTELMEWSRNSHKSLPSLFSKYMKIVV